MSRDSKVFILEDSVGISNLGVAFAGGASFKDVFAVLRRRTLVVYRLRLACRCPAIVSGDLLNFVPMMYTQIC